MHRYKIVNKSLEIITNLGLIPNPLKSGLVPSQDFNLRFPTHLGIVRVPEESQQNSSPVFSGSAGSVHYCPRISVHVGITQCSSRFSSFGSPSSYSISRFPSVLRRQSLGLGCSFGTPRPRNPRPLGLCFPRPSYQQFGVTSSFPSTPTFSESHLRLLRDGSVRQFVSSGLPQETREGPTLHLCAR